MNHLNSILVEGDMVNKPVMKKATAGINSGKRYCLFVIASNRYFKNNFSFDKYVSHLPILATGKNGEICADRGETGRCVRIVGKLIQLSAEDKEALGLESDLVIEAEHIEYRPLTTSKKQEEKV